MLLCYAHSCIGSLFQLLTLLSQRPTNRYTIPALVELIKCTQRRLLNQLSANKPLRQLRILAIERKQEKIAFYSYFKKYKFSIFLGFSVSSTAGTKSKFAHRWIWNVWINDAGGAVPVFTFCWSNSKLSVRLP